LPTTVYAHGWWLRDQRKVSKSSGNVVDPGELISHFGADPLRYFLLREMVFGQDASFSDEAFIDRYNSDLANDLGNTVSRVLTLSRRAFDGCTPSAAGSPVLEAAASEAVDSYRQAMDDLVFHRALEALWRLLAQANQFLVTREPWKKMKDPGARDEVAETLWNVIEATRIVASGLIPFMPEKAEVVLAALGAKVPASLDDLAWGGTRTGVALAQTPPLFPRIDKAANLGEAVPPAEGRGDGKPGSQSPDKKNRDQQGSGASKAGEEPSVIDIDQFFETELRVANVLAAEAIAKSNKLLKLTVDAGEASPRTVVAGVAKQYQPEELVGKQVVIVFNLKPAKLMGVESNGMVLAASEGDGAVLVRPLVPVAAGTRVR
jgi:methionyl-tRNA synthetase